MEKTPLEAATTFETVWQRFSEDLTDSQRKLFKSSSSPEVLLEELTDSHGSHVDRSVTVRAATKIKPIVDGLERFGKALDVIVNIYPEALSLLWGGLRIVIHLAKSYAEFFENIIQCIHTIGAGMSRIRIVESLFPTSDSLRTSLEELYMYLFQFCYDAKQVFQTVNEKKKRGLVAKRLKIFMQGLWSSFNAQFEQTKDDLEKLINRIDREAMVAGLQAANISQEQQEQHLAEQRVENQEARQHREAVDIHLETERMERKEQSKWRAAEAVLWQEQKDISSTMNDFIADTTLLHTCQWLAPVDSELNHELACKAHHPGTCSWILNTREFKKWAEEQNTTLWVSAIPGAGKTVLSASIIQCIHATLGPKEGLAYYYFDYKDQDQQSIRALFASLVAFLIMKYPKYYASVKSKLDKARSSGRTPATSLVRSLLLDAIAHFETLYIVVDALDECEDREELFQQFFNIPSSSQGNIRIFSTSRKNPDIREGFSEILYLDIEMRESVVQEDIRVFVRAEVADIIRKQKIKIRNPQLKEEIINALSEKADGMFQWVKCQVDQLRKLKTDKAIRNCLTKLPKGLDETYSRMLKNLQTQYDEDEIICAQRLLRWLTHAVRPLKVQELTEAIAIECGQSTFDEEAVLTDPMDLLRYGEGLVVLKRGRVHLSHFSVREFLISTTVQKQTPMFYMGTLESNADLAAICLTYLNLQEFTMGGSDSPKSTQSWKFLQYASCEWPVHYRKVTGYEQRPKDLVSSLLSMTPVTKNFANMCNVSSMHKIDLTGCLPLHYCAATGLLEQLQVLLDQGLNVNWLAGRYGTPLNCAVKFDHTDIVSYLIDGMGADPKIASVFSDSGNRSNALHWALDEYHVGTVSEELVFLVLDSVNESGLDEVGGNLQPQRPIHYAARGKRLDIMKLLIQFGAELDAPNLEGKTALAIAVEEDDIQMASYLLEQGAIIKDEDECDSIRESPFGIEALVPNMSGPLWDVMTTLRSQTDDSVVSAYWGFALSSAARDGKLDPLRQLLNTNIEEEMPSPTSEQPASTTRKTSSKSLEAQIGPIFSAFTPALQSSNSDVVLAVLNRLIEVIISLQKEAVPHMGADIHQVIVHDIRDSPFCKLPWYQSSLYLSVLAGYLRTAQLAAHGVIQTGKTNIQPDPLRLIRFGWLKEDQGVRTSLSHFSDEDPQDIALGVRRTTSLEGDSSLLTSLSLATITEFCERARILWHGKRNTRNALNLYFTSLSPPTTKAQIIEFLLQRRADVNFLDRAARTPLYWAVNYMKVDPSLEPVCSVLEKSGGLLQVPDEEAVVKLRASIIEELKEKTLAGEGLSVSAIDLTLKSDWNLLGRLLYWAKDYERATVAFEISSTYDSTLASDPPVFHYFFCDICNPGDYRNETLIKGYRYVVRDSLGKDLCKSCCEREGEEAFRVPSTVWMEEQQHIQGTMEKEFEQMKMQYAGDAVVLENAKQRYKKDLLIAKRDQILEWLRIAADDLAGRNLGSLVEMYHRTDKY